MVRSLIIGLLAIGIGSCQHLLPSVAVAPAAASAAMSVREAREIHERHGFIEGERILVFGAAGSRLSQAKYMLLDSVETNFFAPRGGDSQGGDCLFDRGGSILFKGFSDGKLVHKGHAHPVLISGVPARYTFSESWAGGRDGGHGTTILYEDELLLEDAQVIGWAPEVECRLKEGQ